MAKPNTISSLKRKQNHYRLVIMNEDSFEEVMAFKLTRWSVYFAISTFFIVLVGLTIGMLAFTPLKYYIPGYGVAGQTKEFEALKVRADSIENALILNQAYINNVEKILKGDMVPLDTVTQKIASPPTEKAKSKKSKKKNR